MTKSFVSEEAVKAEYVAPEIRLFRHIVLVAVLDAIYGNAGGDRRQDDRVRSAALNWFNDAGDDFALVCDGAGLLPSQVRTDALSYIRRCRSDPNLAPQRPSLHEAAPARRKAA